MPLTLLGGGLVGVFLYHFYLQLQLPGEVKVLWSWIPLLGHALELGQRPIEFLCDLAACGEDVVGVVIGGKRMFFVLDIFAAPIVFKTNSDYSHLDFHNLVLLNYFGVSPATVKNHVWDDDLMRKWFTQYLIRYAFVE
ncbi:hypothetical protein EON65_21040 [archaeon]|nr:MAG: hypothetical protein EON65_21040 [archaeon]